MTYTFWKSGEPNNYSPGEDYVAANWEWSDRPPRGMKGDWNDTPLDGTTGFGGNTDGPCFGLIDLPSAPAVGLTIQPGLASISWPAAASNFVLQVATSLSSPVAWADATNQPFISGTNTVVTNLLGQGSAFYRLRWSPR